jgi:hypothetical protein
MAACSDGGRTLDTIAPTTSATAGTTTTATTLPDTVPTTEPAETTVATTEATTATTLALTDGPWTVIGSIPEVTEPGLYYELSLPGLYAYFPTKISADDQVFWTMNDTDRPVIEAYLNAQLTINQAMLTRPMDFTLPGWQQYFADAGASYQANVLKPLSDAGQAVDMALGYVLRPWVIDDGRTATTAQVVDCIHDGSLLRFSDGSLGSDSVEGWVEWGVVTSMTLTDAGWQVTAISSWEDACSAFGPRA